MQVTLTVSDAITPAMRLVLSAAADKTPYLRVLGMAVVSVSKRSFTDPSLRAATWSNKKDGTAATLQRSTTMRRSVRVVDVGADDVTVGSDREYAAIHQFGGVTRAHIIRAKKGKALKFGGRFFRKVNHPGSKFDPRPFIPVTTRGLTATASLEAGEAIMDQLRSDLGI